MNRSACAVLGICFGRASGLRGAVTRQSAAGEKNLLTTVIPGRPRALASGVPSPWIASIWDSVFRLFSRLTIRHFSLNTSAVNRTGWWSRSASEEASAPSGGAGLPKGCELQCRFNLRLLRCLNISNPSLIRTLRPTISRRPVAMCWSWCARGLSLATRLIPTPRRRTGDSCCRSFTRTC